MEKTEALQKRYQEAVHEAFQERNEFVTPEHLLMAILMMEEMEELARYFFAEIEEMRQNIMNHLVTLERIPDEVGDYSLLASAQMIQVMSMSEAMAQSAGRQEADIPHVIHAILALDESVAAYVLKSSLTEDEGELMAAVLECFGYEEETFTSEDGQDKEEETWRNLMTCINDQLEHHNPLIGREQELERTIQVLCRKEKNNPLHVGEPGVGKTALVYGLAQRIEEGNVPERLKGCRIYQMDMGQLVAGTSYRGDFEKRIKMIMDGVTGEGNAIVYIDEIHTLVGVGTTGEGALDGSNMLKPYLEGGQVRFIGATTYQEYNRYFQKSRGLVRRFQQIDIVEPSVGETILILKGLQQKYEEYHGVKYAEGVIAYAVEASARYIRDRFLPDKAIDLIDEAGAYREMHPILRKARKSKNLGDLAMLIRQKSQWVDKPLINDVLARVCKIDPKTLHEEDTNGLETLDTRIKSQIYGQDEAVRQVVEAVQMGKAGLLDDEKPIASLLFVGPTGVGKTEVCKVLAKELGIELMRFDMSEYAEKHTVAKLIGSPAGYVGYEDGGLLTDAIRKTPHCVLLLDEIEKAHADIYNILLQVMDYARLTDNKGQKADFRHVILVMTSNAGAQYAHQASLGFGVSKSAGEAMLQAVKKSFKPEFLNRLSGTVVFNDMDRTMASMILDKKIAQLSNRLKARNVTLSLSPAAHDFLLAKGYTAQYGAREMDRIINSLLSPLLTREILFGRLKKGGTAVATMRDEKLALEYHLK